MKLAPRERRLLAILGLAAALLGGRALLQLARPDAPGSPAAAERRAGRAPRGSGAIPERIVEVRTDRLVPDAPAELEVGRDPFRFQAPPPPPPATPPPPPSEEELERRRREAEERARLAAIPRPPEVTLRYLGSFGPRSARIAVFAGGAEGSVLNARQGAILEGKFIVDRIGYESVDLKFVDFPDVPARRLGITR